MYPRQRVRLLLALLVMPAAVLFWRLTGTVGVVQAQNGFEVRDGDRVLFYGDSITEQRLYTTFVEDYVVTRFPNWRVRFASAGWAGDRVTGGAGGSIDQRLERDVIAFRPTVMTVMLGMNDAGYSPYRAGLFTTYCGGYQYLVERVQQALPGVRLTLLQPSPFDDVTRPPQFQPGYNHVLVRYGRFVRELAADRGAMVADLNAPVAAALQRANALEPALASKIVPDRIHPGLAGHLLMAAALLQAWNAPRVVTAVTLDVPGRRVLRAENTEILQPRWSERIAWTQRDRALPMPLDRQDPALQLVLRSSDVAEALDQQTLRVLGLLSPCCVLKIDGERVGSFSRDELARGVNLALLPTPMARQASRVHRLTARRNELQFRRWRKLRTALTRGADAGLAAAQAPDAREQALIDRQRAAAQPCVHRYELIPQEG